MAGITFVRSGMLTTVQDLGRWGYQAEGVPVAGPMDSCSHRVANALVGNTPHAATLEITLLGPEIEFDEERLVAVSGAEFALFIDDRPARHDEAFVVLRGARLRFGERRQGARAYLAVDGGIDVRPVFGSRATHVISAMGGLDGRPLRPGDRLPLGLPRHRARPAPDGVTKLIDMLRQGVAVVRVLPGPQEEFFVREALATLESEPYTIDNRSDRMGFRLVGPRLVHARGADTISDAAPLGSLQVPASGQPIMLMADRQTTGGYPKIATVISADISVAGQLGPGDRIQFRTCSRGEAIAALIAQERALMAIEGNAAR